MIKLPQSLKAWATPDFAGTFKAELAQLGAGKLPLQEALTGSSRALDDTLEVMIISASGEADGLRIKAGIFYSGVVAGCSCADDPTPLDVITEHCVVRVEIDKTTAYTIVTLLTE